VFSRGPVDREPMGSHWFKAQLKSVVSNL